MALSTFFPRRRTAPRVADGSPMPLSDSVDKLPSSLPALYHEYYKAITEGRWGRRAVGVANAKRAFADRIIKLWAKVDKPVPGGIAGHPAGGGLRRPRRTGVQATKHAAAKRKRQERLEQLKLEVLTKAETLKDAKTRVEEMSARPHLFSPFRCDAYRFFFFSGGLMNIARTAPRTVTPIVVSVHARTQCEIRGIRRQEENDSLRKMHGTLVKAANDESAVLLDKATEQETEMRKLYSKRRRNRRRYKLSLEGLKDELEGRCEELRRTLQKKTTELEKAEEERRRMQTFKERAQNEPHVLEAEKQEWKSKVENFHKCAEAEIERAVAKYEEEKKEIQKRIWTQLTEFFEVINLDDDGTVYRILQEKMLRGTLLKRELSILDTHRRRTEEETRELREKQAKIRAAVEERKHDRRRDVLRLPELMTCRPEHEFTFQTV